MSRNREDNELAEILGTVPRPGESPRFAGTMDTGDHGGVMVVDNGAFAQIEDGDVFDPLDVDADPYLPGVTDDDGFPGHRPFVDASVSFEEQEGLEQPEDQSEDFRDDLAEHMAADDEASVDVTGRPMSDLERMAAVAGKKAQAIQVVAPFVRVNPETASRALLGGRASVRPGQDPQLVINWVGEDVEAVPVTISFNPILDLSTDTVIPRGFVRIMWGTRDGIQTVDVDLGSGGQLTVCASVVYVYVGSQTFTNTNITIAASLGFYPCVRTEPLTFTNYMEASPTGPYTFYRPAFASHVYFERYDETNAWTLDFRAQTSGIYTRKVLVNGYLLAPVKLSNDVTKIVCTNVTAGTDKARLIWGLYL